MLDGTIVAGPLVRLACERHIRDLETGAERGLVWRPEAAERIWRFFEHVLVLPEGKTLAPEPFILQPPLKFITGCLFGWHGDDGARRFRTAYVEMGKGNAKSPLAAGIGLYGLTSDEEPGAQVFAAAVTQDQAKILFRDAEKMAAASPMLRELITSHINNLSVEETFSFFRPVSAEHRALDGKRVHMALIDEVHEHPTSLVVDKMRAGTKARRQALIFEITNSGYDRESVCWNHHEYSRQVLEGTVENDSWFAYVCALDEGDNPLEDESCWLKANPMLGSSITEKYLREQVTEAKGMPTSEALIRRLNFCEWTQQQTRYINMDRWRDGATALPADTELVGVPCYGGLDLGKSDDFSAFVLIWTLPDGRVVIRPRFWIPEAALRRQKKRPYDYWLRQGALEVTEGDVVDLDVVEAAIRDDSRRFSVRMVGFDERFAEHMRQHLEGAGLTMVKTPQGFDLNEALVRLNELVMQGRLCHGGHPVLTWMADNFVVRLGQFGQIRPDKDSASDKIDGIVALAMALEVSTHDPRQRGSIYRERRALVVG